MADHPDRADAAAVVGQVEDALSSDREATGIDYDGMLFFDDSNWSDHCAIVSRNCPGVVAQRTPRGLQYSEFVNGLKKFAEAKK